MALCPTCGSGVTVIAEGEGTCYYEPTVEHVLRGGLQAMTTAGDGGAYADVYQVAEDGYTGPEILFGDEGETVFVRRDLAETATAARAYALEHDGSNLSGMEPAEVEMLPVPEHFTGLDVEWATVHPGTPGAVRYWRFQI